MERTYLVISQVTTKSWQVGRGRGHGHLRYKARLATVMEVGNRMPGSGGYPRAESDPSGDIGIQAPTRAQGKVQLGRTVPFEWWH